MEVNIYRAVLLSPHLSPHLYKSNTTHLVRRVEQTLALELDHFLLDFGQRAGLLFFDFPVPLILPPLDARRPPPLEQPDEHPPQVPFRDFPVQLRERVIQSLGGHGVALSDELVPLRHEIGGSRAEIDHGDAQFLILPNAPELLQLIVMDAEEVPAEENRTTERQNDRTGQVSE